MTLLPSRVLRFAMLGLVCGAPVLGQDGPRPVITVRVPNDGAITEGSSGQTIVPIAVALSSAHLMGAAVTLVRSGTARAAAQCDRDTDLALASDTIRINWPPGNRDVRTIRLTICADQRDEANETIELTAVHSVNADVAPGSRIQRLVIFDDDPPPAISVADVTVTEGAVARVGVRLSAVSELGVEVLLTAASGNPAAGAASATAGEACAGTVDFVAASRRVVVPAGKLTAEFTVTTCSNVDFTTSPATLPGPGYSEVFLVTATAPSGATLGKAVGVVTIRDP